MEIESGGGEGGSKSNRENEGERGAILFSEPVDSKWKSVERSNVQHFEHEPQFCTQEI